MSETKDKSLCAWYGCERGHDKGNAYCVFHKKHFSNSVDVKVPKEIPKQSDQLKEDHKELKKQYALFLAKPENKFCRVQMEGCTKVANTVHHVKGRIGEQKFKQEDWLPACGHCNIFLEQQDFEAREKGVKKSKFTPSE